MACGAVQIPLVMFLLTHAYFCLYHALSNIVIRRDVARDRKLGDSCKPSHGWRSHLCAGVCHGGHGDIHHITGAHWFCVLTGVFCPLIVLAVKQLTSGRTNAVLQQAWRCAVSILCSQGPRSHVHSWQSLLRHLFLGQLSCILYYG